MKPYYEAYDLRYKIMHEHEIEWEEHDPSPIVEEMIQRYGMHKGSSILEIGCGEGRDAGYLLTKGYDVKASDVSLEAIMYCKKKYDQYQDHFMQLDVVTSQHDIQYDFIYANAVIHMLVLDEHRHAFYQFIKNHLKEDGIALVCSMGNGEMEVCGDIHQVNQMIEKKHPVTGESIQVNQLPARVVSMNTFLSEIHQNSLEVLESGTTVMPGFPICIYAVMK